ncbi:hypothetical protein Cgig2_021362 [Carnegiea gigantea]|uniref:Uncharacterized protein n=1 Tax=Carnegiea gigantea TaxID=171969 RepID=A0A9Q1QFZ1_9CARY|nr:hypothetical protein Cgig2_021362 [Carnegiea gigantea]
MVRVSDFRIQKQVDKGNYTSTTTTVSNDQTQKDTGFQSEHEDSEEDMETGGQTDDDVSMLARRKDRPFKVFEVKHRLDYLDVDLNTGTYIYGKWDLTGMLIVISSKNRRKDPHEDPNKLGKLAMHGKQMASIHTSQAAQAKKRPRGRPRKYLIEPVNEARSRGGASKGSGGRANMRRREARGAGTSMGMPPEGASYSLIDQGQPLMFSQTLIASSSYHFTTIPPKVEIPSCVQLG